MNPVSVTEATDIFKKIQKGAVGTKAQVVICPPYIYIDALARHNKSDTVLLGAQNLNAEPAGARTGEISGDLLKQFGLSYVILGHSERRELGETDAAVNTKILAALAWKFKPVLCIGEKARDDDGNYLGFIKNQIEQALLGVKKEQLGQLVIAYEPVWAIGAATAMTPSSVHEMVLFIRKTLFELYKTRTISTPIIYGGSVKPENAEAIMNEGEAGGLLIGRQSLDPAAFSAIITIASSLS